MYACDEISNSRSLVLFPYFREQPRNIVCKHRVGGAGFNEFVCTGAVQVNGVQHGMAPIFVAAQHAEHHAGQHIASAAFGKRGITCQIVELFTVWEGDDSSRAF